MWGILIASGIYGIAIILNIGREGLQEYHSNSAWTDEEVEKVKEASVFGWKLFVIISFVLGGLMLIYAYIQKIPEQSQLLQDMGIVTKITESGSRDVTVMLDYDEHTFVIERGLVKKLDLDGLKLCRDTQKQVQILSEEGSGFSRKGQKVVYEIKMGKTSLLSYAQVKKEEEKMSGIWIQMTCGMFTIGILSVFVLVYAKKNPKAYKVICLMKGEHGINPTVAQKVEQYIDNMLSSYHTPKKDEISAGYYGKYRDKLKNRRSRTQDK
mgnify:FL=1